MLVQALIVSQILASTTIPCIDMQDFIQGSSEEKIIIAEKFGKALQEVGFVAVINVGITQEKVDKAYAIAEKYFALPEDEKLKLLSKDGFRGFVPFGKEHAKDTSIGDLKEFYHTTGPTQPEELWPHVPEFKESAIALYQELHHCLKYCLEAVAIYLGYRDKEVAFLSDLLESGGGLMRFLHYPPVDPSSTPQGALRSAPHEDIGVMTVIPRATGAGLQVMTRQGEWIDVIVPKGAAIINSGDTLQYITNGLMKSTKHRVVNPSDLSHRYSVPFFGNFPLDTPLRVLEKCKGKTSPLPPEITYGEFLFKRYQHIGIKK